MVLKHKNRFVWIVLILGWVFDFLFWDKIVGISFALFAFIVIGAGLYLAHQQEVAPARATLWLLVPIAFFAVMSFIRLEPMTQFLNILATLILMGVLVRSFRGGKWWLYGFKDYLGGAFSLGLDTLSKPVSVLSSQPKKEVVPAVSGSQKTMRKPLAVLRGLLLAFPIVLIFAAMLAEADPIFEQALGNLLDIFKIDNLGEYIGRTILICIVAYLLLGVYLHAFYKNHDEELSSDDKRWLPRFLGFTEAGIILGSINLLFLVFVVIQFQYFFGGEGNINLAGYTYAEYARRGFGELVAVAVFSLLLFMGLSFVTKKHEGNDQRVFSALGIMLVALVIIILVSSFQRLLLYEQAYGFTRLRAYTHVFIIWLGVLLLAVILLELLQSQRLFALAAILVGMGFIVTLDVLNVDGFIVRHNVTRAVAGEPMDVAYLASLTEDALPVLAEQYQNPELSSQQEAIAGAIACHAELNERYDYGSDGRNFTWQSFHLARYQATQTWQKLSQLPNAQDFQVFYHDANSRSNWDSYVIVNGVQVDCGGSYYGFD